MLQHKSRAIYGPTHAYLVIHHITTTMVLDHIVVTVTWIARNRCVYIIKKSSYIWADILNKTVCLRIFLVEIRKWYVPAMTNALSGVFVRIIRNLGFCLRCRSDTLILPLDLIRHLNCWFYRLCRFSNSLLFAEELDTSCFEMVSGWNTEKRYTNVIPQRPISSIYYCHNSCLREH
jgi:hypothetical protein